MTREFEILPEFDKQWKVTGFTDKKLQSMQEELTLEPAKGTLMRGTEWGLTNMDVYKSIVTGLNEAVGYEKGTVTFEQLVRNNEVSKKIGMIDT